MGAAHEPLVTLGLPVYNGERFLRAALDSLLGQTLGDFELVVSDNASSDGSWDICNEYARRDPRMRLFRQSQNLGAPANWNFTARQARGRYFKWASASDVCAPGLLARCAAVLEDESVALAFGHTCFIDEAGRELGVFERDFAVGESRPHLRFGRICHGLSINNAQSGLIRMAALRRTRLDRMYPSGDLVLMAELAMLGKWVLLDEVLLYRRAGPQHFTAMRSAEELQRMFRPSAGGRYQLVNLRRHLDFFCSALASPVPVGERVRAAQAALKGLYWDGAGVRDDVARLLSRARA